MKEGMVGWYALRSTIIIMLVITELVIINYTTILEIQYRTNASMLITASILVAGITALYKMSAQITEQPTLPAAMPNGGMPEELEQVAQDNTLIPAEIQEMYRQNRQLQTRALTPEIIQPRRDAQPIALLSPPVNFQDAGKQVILEKILDALRKGEINVKLGGSIDEDGEVQFDKLTFKYSSRPATATIPNRPTTPTVQQKQRLTQEGRRT